MKVIYSWRNKNWVEERNGTEHWIGNPVVRCLFCGTEVENVQGCFAAVWESTEKIHLVSDIIGSFPLFYSVTSDSIYISDDAVLIAERTNSIFKADNIYEFRKTGYVTERETLFQNIYELNPGTKIIIDKINGTVDEVKWFQLEYKLLELGDSVDNVHLFDECLMKVFSELTERLNGNTAIVPLSGGLDSRLIVTYLKKVGYENVVCLSYGRKGNWETQKSQRIASCLGYPWLFVEYNSDKWKNLMRTPEYYDFLEWSCRGRSIGCLQALPAILEIKKNRLVSDDGIVIPGHALDFTLGSHITSDLTQANENKLIKTILDVHYVLADKLDNYGDIEKWKNSIDIDNPINAYMLWEYHNRQSKFIANDVRAYEYAGYTFELPLWDIQIQRFAMKLTLDELMDRKFQRDFTRRIIDPFIGLEEENKLDYDRGRNSEIIKIKAALKKNIFINKWTEWKSIRNRRFNDTNGFLSWLSEADYKMYSTYLGKNFILNSIEADDYIKQLSKRFSVNL